MMRRRQSEIARAACLTGALALTAMAIPTHSATISGADMRVPICGNGAVYFEIINLGDETPPEPNRQQSACHGPCICCRKKPILGG